MAKVMTSVEGGMFAHEEHLLEIVFEEIRGRVVNIFIRGTNARMTDFLLV